MLNKNLCNIILYVLQYNVDKETNNSKMKLILN